MRKAGIALTVIGAAAFAALLAWGLTFSAAQADDTPTATATVTATATAAPQTCSPVIPGTYNGTVTLGGVPAPDGTSITVSRGGVQWGSTTTSGGKYVLDVPQGLQVNPPCFADTSGPLTFTCDGVAAAETPNAGSGLKDQNLTCAAVATPTATVTVTTTATATVTVAPTGTAVVPPPTGMGSGGEGGGFLWWPLALAAAALTAVAGLYTARRATR